MPGMNGKQFLTAIKDHQHFSGIPIVIYSTSNAEDKRETILMGAKRFITKPDNIDKISELISEVLETG